MHFDGFQSVDAVQCAANEAVVAVVAITIAANAAAHCTTSEC